MSGSRREKPTMALSVRSKGGEPKKSDEPQGAKENKRTSGNKKKLEENTLSEEDQKLKDELELMVTRVTDKDPGVQKLALEALRTQIRTATSSMTSVPKPLKFLLPQYETLKANFDGKAVTVAANRGTLADILSVLAMTRSSGDRDSLKYKLLGTPGDLESWGAEYVRNLTGEIGVEYAERKAGGGFTKDLDGLIDQIIPFNMSHHAEHEALDLLMEVGALPKVVAHVTDTNYSRICRYLTATAAYLPEPEDKEVLRLAHSLYMKVNQLPDALRVALMLNDKALINEVWSSPKSNPVLQKQLAMILARAQVGITSEDEKLEELLSNSSLSEHFINLAKDLDVLEAKTPEDIYKVHLEPGRTSSLSASTADSAKQNLAKTITNAFVNCGFLTDKLMTPADSQWMYKNRESGLMSVSASLGMIMLWDTDGALPEIDKFMYSTDDYTKAGALLAVGLVHASVRNGFDPAFTLLSDALENNQSAVLKQAALLGLGIAYAGTGRTDVYEVLSTIVGDASVGMDTAAMAGLAIGMVNVGTCNSDAAEMMILACLERPESEWKQTTSRYLLLGLGLLFLGQGAAAETTLEALQAMSGPMAKYAKWTVDTCAYAGTGNVLKIQECLHAASEHPEEAEVHQSVASLGVALIAMGEDIGSEMALRTYDHMLQHGEPAVRRAVPVALALQSLSHPEMVTVDKLSKLSHDTDQDVSSSAILGLGLVAAGTNNSRVAQLLRGLASYWQKDNNQLFCVRVAQGLLHMGKGALSLSPFYSDRALMNPTSVAGVLVVLHSMLDMKNTILSSHHYMVYFLSSAIFPRMLITVDEEGEWIKTPVRVGQAVDTVGQAGRPKTITGFQTQTTPVLLGYGDRAELATEEYLPQTSVLEGLVILKKNPDYKPDDLDDKGKKK